MTTTQQNSLKPAALLALGAICISFAPVFVKLLLQQGMGPTPIALWRLLFGGALFFTLSLALGGSLKLRAGVSKWALIAGALFAIDLFVWHQSILLVGAGMATILGNMQVFATSMLGRAIFKERLRALFKIAVPLGIVGVVLLTGVGSGVDLSQDYLLGVGFGLSTAVVYALYLITLKSSSMSSASQEEETAKAYQKNQNRNRNRNRNRNSALTDTATLLGWISFVSAALLLVAGAIEGETSLPPNTLSWFYSFALALIAQVIGWLLIYNSLAKLPASRSALILLLQPTFATIWGALLFSESMTLLQLTGAALTLSAIYLGGAKK